MSETEKIGERIRALRTSKEMTQAKFADALGMDQGRISQWEAGEATPSVEAWIKLAAVAAQSSPSEAVFFWQQTGLDAAILSSVARALLQQEEGKMGAILSAAETVLKRRLADPKELAGEGKMVRVPPFAGYAWKGKESAPELLVSAELVTNLASTYYLVAGVPLAGGIVPGDRIVFDTFGASERKFASFDGKDVLLNFAENRPQTEESRSWPVGLSIGRLAAIRNYGGVCYIVLVPRDSAAAHLVPHRALQLDLFSALDRLPGPVQEQIVRGARVPPYRNVVRCTEEKELSTRTLPEGIDIMGRVIALFHGARER